MYRKALREADASDARYMVEELQRQIKELKKEKAGAQEEIAGLKEEKAGAQEEIAGLKEEKAGLQKENANLQEQIAKLHILLEGLKQE